MVAFLPTGLAAYSLINWIIQNLMTCARLPPGSRPLPETSFWRLPTSTTTSRGRQRPGRPKSTNLITFVPPNFFSLSLLSLTKETWGDAGGEGVVGAVQQVWHRDGDHQDWKVRKCETHPIGFDLVVSFCNERQRLNIRAKSLEVMLVEKEWHHSSNMILCQARAQCHRIIDAWDDDAPSAPFIALSRHADP